MYKSLLFIVLLFVFKLDVGAVDASPMGFNVYPRSHVL
jgi:hypothetical protein